MRCRGGKSKLCERTGSVLQFHARIVVGSCSDHSRIVRHCKWRFNRFRHISLRFWNAIFRGRGSIMRIKEHWQGMEISKTEDQSWGLEILRLNPHPAITKDQRALSLKNKCELLLGQGYCQDRPTKPSFRTYIQQTSTSWWFQPIWKILVKLEIFPK